MKNTKKILNILKKPQVAGGMLGGVIGSNIGIAALGGAISGTLPLAIVGIYIGHRYKKSKMRQKHEKRTATR